MREYSAMAVSTDYWRPRENYLNQVIDNIRGKITDHDVVILSEKAISMALGNIIDEASIRPSLSARFVAGFWMRCVWGYFLGYVCHFPEKTLQTLRKYPPGTGSRHKQLVLQQSGLLQTLMFGSEGGIDGSNAPYSYVCLPLVNAKRAAEEIRKQIRVQLGKRVVVIIADTDKTYSFRNFHFTPRPKPVEGIFSFGGAIAYVVGRMLKLRRRATPLAVVKPELLLEDSLDLAEIANRSRGFGAGRTVWDMAKRFNVDLTGVSWEMLDKVKHKPIVIIRRKR